MFEIAGDDILLLSDADLRSLVVRLAISELRSQGLPLSAVTAGGHQDAPDGGLDVRVECPLPLTQPDFVPRVATGFQVKKPDMPPGRIRDEMRPDGALRPVIQALVESEGAYIIVSAQGSVADAPLRERRAAMRDQLADLADPERLHTDFYDRDRLARWVNEYSGTAAWVRSRVHRALDGWGAVADWGGPQTTSPYLLDASISLLDETVAPRRALPIADGIERLRAELSQPGRCVRLIGLSGLGKTRLVQALFETGVGAEALDAGLAVYTDYSSETRPSARDMARGLIIRGQRAILIVDNCNPETHGELAKLCFGSPISLLTVEYDVREDEPEHTGVFRLQAASSDVLEAWLEQNFAHISRVDRRTIAELSSGNFRVARALAETLGQGETLGRVRGQELFERIFRQRNPVDKSLLFAAQDMALAYSIDGADIGPGGELAAVGVIRSTSAQALFEALAELHSRGVVQSRGRWRAILPQAIANSLATNALRRIPAEVLDRMIRDASPRLRISISRRLGNLHDSQIAREAVTRWFAPTGPFGDLFAPASDSLGILTNLAPLAPSEVLSRIGDALNRHPEIADEVGPNHWHWIRLIKALAFEPDDFSAAAKLLLRFVVAEPEENPSSAAKDALSELFHMVLSGTMAPPEQRRAIVRDWLDSDEAGIRECGLIALCGLLKAGGFSSTSAFDFGSRSRSFGWEPGSWARQQDWFVQNIAMCGEYGARYHKLRAVLATEVRDLWHMPACREALNDVATALLANGPWIEGWIELRETLRFDRARMPEDVRLQLEALIDRLKPTDLLHRARAAVLGSGTDGWDINDPEVDADDAALSTWERAELLAEEVGRALASDAGIRRAFMPEVTSRIQAHQNRAFRCGRGIADAAADLDAMWASLLSDYEALPDPDPDVRLLGGFLTRAADRDRAFAERILDEVLVTPSMAPTLPYFQACVDVDARGISRLRQVIAAGMVRASSFLDLANGRVEPAPPAELAELLRDVARLPDGDMVALDMLHMYLFSKRSQAVDDTALLEVGREILSLVRLSGVRDHRTYGLSTLVKWCLGGGGAAYAAAQAFAEGLRESLELDLSYSQASEAMGALAEVQPRLVLDIFVLPRPDTRAMWRWHWVICRNFPFNRIGSEALLEWAAVDPDVRYPLIGAGLPLFSRGDFDESASVNPLFKLVLATSPDPRAFLGIFDRRIYPSSYTGSRKAMLEARRQALVELADEMLGEVATWIREGLPALDRAIESALDIEAEREESFE